MSLFPTEMESERLRYERLHPDNIDPFELYEHVKEGAPAIDEITEYVTWDPYSNPKEAVEWVETCGTDFENGEGATYVVRPNSGERAGSFAGLAGLGVEWDQQRATLGTWFRKPFWGQGYSGERAARFCLLQHLESEWDTNRE
nr:GNAT family N-acetyltransferase [Halorhabdus sp. CUG00001]